MEPVVPPQVPSVLRPPVGVGVGVGVGVDEEEDKAGQVPKSG